ncbi:MAG: CopG family transcriptional regulator [Clostridiales bacterium]|nr:CopG family transcriptional regulator [Clostridiales bacterium]
MQEEIRLGFIGIVINDRVIAAEVNALLGQYARVIRARVGVPDADSVAAVIGLIVEGDNPSLGALTAKLGNLRGVEVKSALSRRNRLRESVPPDHERT